MSINGVSLAYGKVEDPDAQATITDYLDYTEYLPADLNRALKLITKLDEDYIERSNTVHELSRRYGELPKHVAQDVDHAGLRCELSYNLELALKAREASFGEAERMAEMIKRYHARLLAIQAKLLALPKPPSRDPTPVARSPPTHRKTPTRIHLRLDGARAPATTSRIVDKDRKKARRNRRVTIPGEVLPPPNPESPQDFTDSDWESIPPSPLPIPTSRVGGSRSRPPRPGRIRPPKHSKTAKERPPRVPRQPGMGTNVHSQVAGISTSNALSLLPKPPPDAENGSEHAPWMRLTEYEMALLRKRMKKNAIWTPSETMIRRELAAAGRGPDAYRKRKADCEEKEVDFVDTDNVAASSPNRPLVPGEIRAESLGIASENLSNRGMKLNEAKKQKREQMLERTREETRETQRNLDSLGSTFKDLFKKPGSLESPRTPLFPPVNGFSDKDKSVGSSKKFKKKASRKRTNEDRHTKLPEAQPQTSSLETVAAAVTQQVKPSESTSIHESGNRTSGPPSKRRKKDMQVSSTISTTTTTVPLASPGPTTPSQAGHLTKEVDPAPSASASKRSKVSSTTSKIETTTPRPRRVSLTLRGPASPQKSNLDTQRVSTQDSRRTLRTASPMKMTRDRSRRASSTMAAPVMPRTPTTPAPVSSSTAGVRRSRRPVSEKKPQDAKELEPLPPVARNRSTRKERAVLITTNQNSARKKPGLKGKHLQQPEAIQSDLADPNEPRYCICNDVSWGEMVACENTQCKGEWFHYACVGLTEAPARRAKWYCPPCKAKLKI